VQEVARKDRIGSGDAPVIMGVSPYKTSFCLYLEKTGVIPEEDISHRPAVFLGNVLEPIALDAFVANGHLLTHRQLHIARTDYPWATATIDGIDEHERVIEVKTSGFSNPLAWRPLEHIHSHWFAQVQHQLWVAGKSEGIIVLLAPDGMTWWPIKRDQDYIDAMMVAECRFWEQVCGIADPPAPSTEADMRLAFTGSNGEVIECGDALLATVKKLATITQHQALLEAEESEMRAFIMGQMGEAEFIKRNGKTLVRWSKGEKGRRFSLYPKAALSVPSPEESPPADSSASHQPEGVPKSQA
jgi:putative phage-type endonuclease